MMKHYELMCVLPGTLAEDEIAPMVKNISQVLGNYNAQHVTLEDMGKSRLAYPIKLIRYGYFQLFRFEIETTEVEKMEKSMRLIGGLLRVSIQISDPKKEKTYILAVDPTAPSGRQKGEDGREEKRFERRAPRQEERASPVAPVEAVATPAPVVVVEELVPVVAEAPIVPPVEEQTQTKAKRSTKKKTDVSLDNIDARLDEILQEDIDKV